MSQIENSRPEEMPRRGLVLSSFAAGNSGPWRIESISAVVGDGLPEATHLNIREEDTAIADDASWVLRGVTSNGRYVRRAEQQRLVERQEGLGRTRATRAALIPIRKTPAWWDLAQDERRAIFEERSSHIAIGMDYLPAIARRLFHCRDLGGPFDFLTWFEYAPEDSASFENLVARLRGTAEWAFVDREVDIRLSRA